MGASSDDDGTDAQGSPEPDFDGISTTCPTCTARMRPVDLDSGAVVLRCPRCGQVAI